MKTKQKKVILEIFLDCATQSVPRPCAALQSLLFVIDTQFNSTDVEYRH